MVSFLLWCQQQHSKFLMLSKHQTRTSLIFVNSSIYYADAPVPVLTWANLLTQISIVYKSLLHKYLLCKYISGASVSCTHRTNAHPVRTGGVFVLNAPPELLCVQNEQQYLSPLFFHCLQEVHDINLAKLQAIADLQDLERKLEKANEWIAELPRLR